DSPKGPSARTPPSTLLSLIFTCQKAAPKGAKKPSTGQNDLGPENPAQVPFVRESVSASKRRDEPDISSAAPPVNTRIENFPTQSAKHSSSKTKHNLAADKY
ncbi:hypothetical protein, partial [Microvirga aerophila]|uniref:hypothetical protein n=1 Tax=Microvirga aerophila TaxID=670291 RepID=UPI0013B3BC30